MTSLEMNGLGKQLNGREVFSNVTATAKAGETLVLRGKNGSGKTTFLNCLLGELPFTTGELCWNSQKVAPATSLWSREVFAVMDDFTWFPGLTVRDHMMLLTDERSAEKALDRLGAGELVDRVAVLLSSGQQRRVALATSLVRKSSVVLLDEPEQRLDDDVLCLVVDLVEELTATGRIVVMSTHRDDVQQALADHTVVLAAP